jgi:hypothetical protein
VRNLERKAPKHVLDELRADFHRIVYAPSAETARTAWTAFERAWGKQCPGVVKSLQEGGAELLTFFSFPKAQWWSCPGLVEGELLRCAPGGVDTACSCSTTSGGSGGRAVVGG